MPVTRSASVKAAAAGSNGSDASSSVNVEKVSGTKRKASMSGTKTSKKKAKSTITIEATEEILLRMDSEDVNFEWPSPTVPPDDPSRSLVPAKLTFSFEDAKKHLISVDPRFEVLFTRLKCRPFEHLEQFDPFSTLASSILGQQISWKAARAIQHRFIRLFNPGLPESPSIPYNKDTYFPTAKEVATTDVATLRSAGLSERKASYILDLAQRFADGRLSTQKLLDANDEELRESLIAVKGIGPWTVDMFAIFSLRRPDILPAGDLGVQRGVARWFLAAHSPSYRIRISADKLPVSPDDEAGTQVQAGSAVGPASTVMSAIQTPPVSQVGDVSAILPAAPIPSTPKRGDKDENVLPPPVTPSVNKALNVAITANGHEIEPLPGNLTVSSLKGRLNGQQRGKSPLLTETEMKEMTAAWQPYRSVAVYYMWALAEDT